MTTTKIKPSNVDESLSYNVANLSITTSGGFISFSDGSKQYSANTSPYANGAFAKANTANTLAQAAYDAANNSVDTWVRSAANSASSYANSAYNAANNATDTWVRNAANSASSYANSGFSKANTANTLAQAAYDKANLTVAFSFIDNQFTANGTTNTFTLTTSTNSQDAFVSINGQGQIPNLSYNISGTTLVFSEVVANNDIVEVKIPTFTGTGVITGVGTDSWARDSANSASSYANAAFATANSGGSSTDSWARDSANSASSYANSAFNKANTANTLAQAAYDKANTGGSGSSNTISTSNTSLTATSNGISLTVGSFSTSGDISVKEYILYGTTTDATETQLLIDGTKKIPVSTNTSISYTVDIIGRRTDVPNYNGDFQLKGCVINNVGTTTDAGTLYEIVVHRDNSSWVVDARADNATDTLGIYVNGVSGSTIKWVAYVKTVEITQ